MEQKKKTSRKGCPNKVTQLARVAISDTVVDYCESGLLNDDLALLEPKERLELIVKLAQFVIPKLQAVSADVTATTTKTIEDRLIQLSQQNE